MNQSIFVAMAGLLLLGQTGCTTTVRSMTASRWIVPPGAAGPAAVASGAAAPAAAAPASAGGIGSHYYITYWEGRCGGVTLGCSRGDTKVKHCTVAADNNVQCVEDVAATQALMPR